MLLGGALLSDAGALVGLELGIISRELFSILVFIAIFTTALVPVTMKWGIEWLDRSGELFYTDADLDVEPEAWADGAPPVWTSHRGSFFGRALERLAMRVVENTMAVPIESVLERPLFCFLASVDDGLPRVSPLWYLWEDGTVWIIADREKTYVNRVEATPEAALAVVEFLPGSGVVRHVGFRGRATAEPFDLDRANRLLRRYLGPDRETWDERFLPPWSDRWCFIKFEPETVVARDQSYTVGLG